MAFKRCLIRHLANHLLDAFPRRKPYILSIFQKIIVCGSRSVCFFHALNTDANRI